MLHRSIEVLQHEGVKAFCAHALAATVYRRMILFEHRLSSPLLVRESAVHVGVGLLRSCDLDEYEHFRPGHRENARDRMEQGHYCFIARQNGAIVSACWAATGIVPIDYLRLAISLSEDEAYMFDSYTAPAFRNRNIATVRGREMVRFFRDRGYSRLLAAVLPENRPAFRPVEKIGYRPIGRIGCVRVGRLSRGFCRTVPDARPVVIAPPGTAAVR